MPTHLSEIADEKSTFVVSVPFVDENNAAITPDTGLNWTLSDRDGDVINARSGIAITPATTIHIALSGDDLALPDINDRIRVLTVQGTYDSALGNNLPIKIEVTFEIASLSKVS